MEPLTPFGGFSVLNAMRTIKPGQTKPVVVQFEPLAQQIYEERVIIYSGTTMVSVNLKGTGVRPEVKIEPEDGLMSF
jgi:DNA-binding protein YbaB